MRCNPAHGAWTPALSGGFRKIFRLPTAFYAFEKDLSVDNQYGASRRIASGPS
jgi:hypothetical protein